MRTMGNIFQLFFICMLLASVSGSIICNYCIGVALQGGAINPPYNSIEAALNSEIGAKLSANPQLSGLMPSPSCPRSATLTRSCMNQCATISVQANTQNYAGPQLLKYTIQMGNSTLPVTATMLALTRYGNFAFRGCLEDAPAVLGMLNEDSPLSQLSDDKFHQAGTCSTAQGAIFSSSYKASLCSCNGATCNNADVSGDIGAATAHQPADSSQFAAECPPQPDSPPDFINGTTPPVVCSTNANCPSTQMCCADMNMETQLCKDPLYAKQVAAAKCSEARFTSNTTGQLLTAIMQASGADSSLPFPPFSNDCNQAQTSSSQNLATCKTYAVVVSITADFRNYNGPPDSLSEFFSLWAGVGFGPASFADMGQITLMTRTCAEELYAEAMSDGFPMMGDGVETLAANLLIYNIPITISVKACNSAGGCANSVVPLGPIASNECYGGYVGSSCGEITVAGIDIWQILVMMNDNSMMNNGTSPCPPGLTGEFCEVDIDECASSPCYGYATCVDNINYYQCICPSGFIGERCNLGMTDMQFTVDNSTSSPPNNGITSPCPPGLTGEFCEVDINECYSNPCLNGATCVDNINYYQCICPSGFIGERCNLGMTNMQFTVDNSTSPPPNNGTSPCPAGFTGTHCEIDINECASSPCLNGGTCVNNINYYQCTCRPGFTGQRCGVAVNGMSPTPNNGSGPPSNNTNGGTSNSNNNGTTYNSNNGSANNTINCPPGSTGNDCDTGIRLSLWEIRSTVVSKTTSELLIKAITGSQSGDNKKNGASGVSSTVAVIVLGIFFAKKLQPFTC